MPASTYEYKTVALPQTVQGKRRRGVSEADFVAGMMGELIHLEAVDGWEYLRSDVLAAGSRGGMFSREAKITYYSVLVFRRMTESVWLASQQEAASDKPEVAPEEHPTTPREAPVAPKPPREVKAPPPPPPPPPAVNDPTSPFAQGGLLTTGGQFRTGSASSSSSETGNSPRPPLGSAQD